MYLADSFQDNSKSNQNKIEQGGRCYRNGKITVTLEGTDSDAQPMSIIVGVLNFRGERATILHYQMCGYFVYRPLLLFILTIFAVP